MTTIADLILLPAAGVSIWKAGGWALRRLNGSLSRNRKYTAPEISGAVQRFVELLRSTPDAFSLEGDAVLTHQPTGVAIWLWGGLDQV